MEAYTELEVLFLKVYRLKHLLALADWDAQVMMPDKGSEARGNAMATLEEVNHDLLTQPRVKELLAAAEAGQATLSSVQQANLREMSRLCRMEGTLTDDFVHRRMKLTSTAQVIWRRCRAENDFAGFLPTLRELIAVFREEGRLRAGDSGKAPYDALLDVFEPGMNMARLDALFNNVKSWLPQLLRDVLKAREPVDASITPLKGPFAQSKQEAVGHYLMDIWHFDSEAGRLDISAHPFCGNVQEDVRITTNYRDEEFIMSALGVVHETGHGKYEQNCGPQEMRGQPVCMARSAGVHESQSLFAEMMIARSGAFAEFLVPKAREVFGDQPGLNAQNLRNIMQIVKPGYIRIDADEVSYTLHVILRYEIERDLMEGKLEAEDVPRVWNEKMKEYLGLETEGKDNLGCLQDVHWSAGYFGSFCGYSIGSMFAAQLMATVRRELGDDTVEKCVRTGELKPLLEKQREKIWSQGCLHETDELMRRATGEPLNPKYLREHLERRYLNYGANPMY